ncbi:MULTISPECIES: MFS transporter [unclassified Mesobacillus]|uniref:MFS transporter n=1 Tax=unclassified Mesobacillus TaxID=2675270 RepID=UPI00203B03F5|nr:MULTISPECIES: MFS transporter [unclassified Mesobacillus]MCM3121842.1 MFS transporter [Mesobacillus sp. MER 33]MCM3231806.1 MFS transporter [Mesobacillus sp. MER 48]
MKGWKNPILLILGIGISNIGNWIYFVAINLLVLKITGSAAAIAGLFIIRPLAILLTNTWAGSVIDRVNKRKLMIWIDIIRGIFIVAIPFFTSLFPIYIIMFLTNIAGAFFGPTSETYIAKLVPPEKRKRFNSIFSFATSGAMLVGPSVSGLLIMYGSINTSIYINAVTFFFCAAAIYFLPDVDGEEGKEKYRDSITVKMIAADWKAVADFGKTAVGFMVVFMIFQFITLISFALDSQEVTFIQQVIGLSEKNYGLLVSLTGAGYMAGSFAVSALASRLSIRTLLGLGSFLSVTGYFMFFLATSDTVPMAVIGFIIIGFFSPFSFTGYTTFFQNNVPLDLMGRFSSAFAFFQAILQILLTLLLGYLAETLKLQTATIGFASFGLLLAITLTAMVFLQSKKNLFVLESERNLN